MVEASTAARAVGTRRRVLALSDDAAFIEYLERTLDADVERATAMEVLAADMPPPDGVAVRLADDWTSALELFAAARARWPQVELHPAGSWEDLREVIRNFGELSVSHVLAWPPPSPVNVAEELPPAFTLVADVVQHLARAPGAYIRSVYRPHEAPVLQFVVPHLAAEELSRTALATFTCLKAKGAAKVRAARLHPACEPLGHLHVDQSLYATSATWVALLPWTGRDRTTVAIGLCDVPEDQVRGILEAFHRIARAAAPSFPLPTIEGEAPVRQALEYDWVVTRGYVGPDRRAKPTSLFNRYVLFGRRRAVPQINGRPQHVFVDRLPGWVVTAAAVYLVLSTIDTVCTWYFVGTGRVAELNPVLRVLLAEAPVLFVLFKTSLALGAFFVVARFHLLRAGAALLGVIVAVFLLLDTYWAWVLLLAPPG